MLGDNGDGGFCHLPAAGRKMTKPSVPVVTMSPYRHNQPVMRLSPLVLPEARMRLLQ